jgi:transposase-like protein
MKKPKTIDQLEKEAIFESMERNGNNKNAVARELGISPATVRNKLTKYGVTVVREVVVPIAETLNNEREFEPYKSGKAKLRG